ncbi:MAG TPA: L,D-transpeptidase [Bacteriovoracaceae bacterium]|nr:L,D-transpeptidase [Bacteriovoracaceae bacterium]
MILKTLLVSALIISSAARATVLTDEMALEAGMTPVSEAGMDGPDLAEIMTFDRSEYVSTIPSLDDIEKVIRSHKQVIVVNKAVSGKDAQTLTVYQNGAVKPLTETTVITTVVNGKTVNQEVSEEKPFVKISTGRERNETAASGRKYLSTTPKGFFRPQRVYKMYYSATWKADLPNAVFINCSRNDFNKECGIAIHATSASHYAALGKRDSGGCVRTKLEVSKQIRELVMESGLGTTQFKIKNEGYRRDKVINNSVQVDLVNRDSGDVMNKKINSWDTVIVVYE